VATFRPGESALESLLAETGKSDFAVFILTAEDWLRRADQQEQHIVPRDNLVFEMGMFISALGRPRVALCRENPPGLVLPTDLNGQNCIDFSIPDNLATHEFHHIVSGISGTILKQFASATPRRSAPVIANDRIDEPTLSFGDSRHTDIIVDSAFQPADRRSNRVEIQRSINAKRVFPTRLFYATEEAATAWLELTRDPDYRFFRSSVSLLRQQATRIVEAVSNHMPGSAPDLVSLGSGDGEKDSIILTHLISKLGHLGVGGKISYFPLDYSFYLITETVRTTSSNVPKGSYRIKPIVGDILDLVSFRYVYENFPSPNLFSILGNTIGNNDERAIVEAIRVALIPGDMLLVEVNTNRDSIRDTKKSDFVVGRKNMRHTFSPLNILGLEFEDDRFSWAMRSDVSACPGTLSVETLYKSDDLGSIHVSLNHRYDFQKFCGWISSYTETEIAWTLEQDDVGLVLLAKPNP
jgi:hypothetical protein